MMLARFSVQKQAMLLRHSASSMHRGSLLCPSPVTSSSRCTQMTRKFEPINTRSFFTKSSAKNSKSNKEKPKWSDRWRRLAKVVKYIRIPAIVGSVYMLGYQQVSPIIVLYYLLVGLD